MAGEDADAGCGYRTVAHMEPNESLSVEAKAETPFIEAMLPILFLVQHLLLQVVLVLLMVMVVTVLTLPQSKQLT